MKLKTILRPTVKVIVSVFVLLSIAYIGHSFGWSFSDPEITGSSKPFLHDFLINLPGSWLFQIVSQLLLIPFYSIYFALVLVFGVVGIEIPMAIYWAAVATYLYLLAALLFNGIPMIIANRASNATVSRGTR